jgi:hypothetical protein
MTHTWKWFTGGDQVFIAYRPKTKKSRVKNTKFYKF